MKEIWKDIEGWYTVSNKGGLKSYRKRGQGSIRLDEPVPMKPWTDNYGYQHVVLYTDEGTRTVYIHVLVLEAFVGPCPEGMQCRHLDGDPSNNRWPKNICWGTSLENHKDQVRHGTRLAGRYKPNAVEIPREIVTEIKERHNRGESLQSIVKDFDGLSRHVAGCIVKGTHWSLREA